MRLPRKIRINNRPWKVIKDNRISSSHFSFRDNTIRIGSKGNSNREMLNGFMHEVAEVSCVERYVRCTMDREIGGNGDYRFIADHNQFEGVITDLSAVIGDIMKLD